MTNLSTHYRENLKQVARSVMDELTSSEINWHTVELIGRELVVLSGEALQEQVKQRQEHIKSKYGEVKNGS